MDTQKRHQTIAIIKKLTQHPQLFSFFQAVRLLLCINKKPLKKTLCFKTSASLTFATSDIDRITALTSMEDASKENLAGLWEIVVTFMGLIGGQGTLPPHYTEHLINQVRMKNFKITKFFDIFQQRSLTLFYQAWERHHFYLGYENAKLRRTKNSDNFSQTLYSLAGIEPHANKDLGIIKENFAFYATHFARPQRTIWGLQSIISNHFSVPVNIEEFQSEWSKIGTADCTRLSASPNELNHKLNFNTIVGERILLCNHKIRIILGPLSRSTFTAFLPNSKTHAILKKLIRIYLGIEFNFEIKLILMASELVPSYLTANNSLHLSWNSWLSSKCTLQNKADVILHENRGISHDYN